MSTGLLLNHVQKCLRNVGFGVKFIEDDRFLRYLEKDEEIVFEGRSFVLQCLENGLSEEIEKRGGVIRRRASSKTDYVVFDPLAQTIFPGMKNVFAQIENGADIKVITLLNLLRSLKGQDLSEPKLNRSDDIWKIENGILWEYSKKTERGTVIEIPKGVFAIARGVFSSLGVGFRCDDSDADDVTVVFPDTVLCCNDDFADYFWCSKLVFSENMRIIPYMGYVGSQLKVVEIPEGVEYIGDYAFQNSEELKTVVLPASLCYLGQYAFAGCEKLETVIFTPLAKDTPALKTIPKCCFLDCEELRQINIPESVTEIHPDAFLGCEKLKKTDVIRTAVEDAARPLTAEREQRSCVAKVDEKIRKKYIKDDALCFPLISVSTAYREIEGIDVRIFFGFDELFERINDVFRHERPFFAAEDAVSCKTPKPLPAEDAEARALAFLSICDRLLDDKILGSVFDFMEREKDNSLTMCSTFVLGALQAVGENGKYLQLVAEDTSDFFGYSISVDLKETELTPYTYNAAANSVFLKYLEQKEKLDRKPKMKKTKKGKAPATIKIFYVEPWGDSKKNSVKVPIIAMEDGRYAIDAEPYKALSDFECLVGNDKDGYEVNLKNPYLHYEVCSDGLSVNVEYLTTMLLHCKDIWPRIKIIEEYVNDKKVWVHDLLGTVFPTTYEEGEIRTNKKHLAFFKKKEYLAEYVYTVLCAVDEIFELSRSSEYAQFLADHAERKKNGTLNRNKCQEIYLPQKVKTVHPVVRMNFRARNGGDHRISVSFVRIAPTGDIEWENVR